ncbi:MAG: GNAT family N-acetyltransferase [Candidatus Thiothrix singaporensis]|uniref:GNAT family N-acetyltransferase n=1 Tax=Candidatus Thiothrix singaporensis TaxID=2799669 RepID=A0A7L6AYV7_9GAMM|nr:MAG: GNAT family N-acetyltransferase [Candidatus Thiothrix singaporensis]
MAIRYQTNTPLSTDQFIDVLRRSTLGERRPIDDHECMEGMVNNSNLLVTAWDGDKLVGVARSMTDFHYACYLSDLAVDRDYQRQGIGKQLQALTRQQLGRHCKLILIAAPAANAYYQQLGYTAMPRCWVLDAGQALEPS